MSKQTIRVTPAILQILLALAEGDSHGYALLTRLEETPGLALGPSSLYYTLGRLQDHGLIEQSDATSGADPHSEQRRSFRLTRAGRMRLEREVGILSGIVDQARALGLRSGS